MQFNSQSWETEDWVDGFFSGYEKKDLSYSYDSLEFDSEMAGSVYLFKPLVKETAIGIEELADFLPVKSASSQLTSLMAG